MSERTKIAWCDSTDNFWEGCTKKSAGCANCYAEARDKRFTGGKLWGKGAPRRKSKSAVSEAFKLNRKPWICDECGKAYPTPQAHFCERQEATMTAGETGWHRRRVFSLSLGDWLDPEVPVEWLAEMMHTIWKCDQVQWILCTKRPELWEERLDAVIASGHDCCGWLKAWRSRSIVPELCVLTSVENQEMADERIPAVLRIQAACRGLSLEPLLGPVEIAPELWRDLGWAIIGGESGPNARPCNIEWVRSLVQQGLSYGVPVFVKQLGANSFRPSRGEVIKFPRHPKGGDPDEWPDDLQVRQFPFRPTTENQPKNPAESAAESRVTVQAES